MLTKIVRSPVRLAILRTDVVSRASVSVIARRIVERWVVDIDFRAPTGPKIST